VEIRKVSLRGTSSSCLLGPFGLTLLEVGTYLHDQMLFTAGMTLLDSIDSILMLYSYTGFAEHRFQLFEPVLETDARDHKSSVYREAAATSVSPAQLPRSEGSHENEIEPCPLSAALSEQSEKNGSSQGNMEQPVEVQLEDTDAKIRDIRKEAQRELLVKRNMMSGLSILLTLMSIVVAFRYEFPPEPTTSNPTDTLLCVSISLITIMGLIGDKCVTCSAAAKNDNKGLAGGWWRFWAKVRDLHVVRMV
jgi:nickel/cobalt transporter (NiCoT) family protein